MIKEYEAGRDVTEICREYDISKATFYSALGGLSPLAYIKNPKSKRHDHNIKIRHSMNEELQKWHTRLTLELKALDQPLNRLHATLVEMKNSGINKDQAYDLLASLRTDCSTEDQEDNILDLMDIVVGYCQPKNRIWE